MNSNNLTFNEAKHEYKIGTKHIPSVTQILSPISDRLYKHIDFSVLGNKANIGTEVHKLIEQHSKFGLENVSDNERVNNYFRSYLEWNKKQESYIYENEFKETYSNQEMLFAGTIDNIRMIGNDVYLIDYKTTATPNETILALQLYGYKLIAEQKLGITINRFGGLVLSETEEAHFIDLTDLVNDLDTKAFFESLYRLNKYFDLYGIKAL